MDADVGLRVSNHLPHTKRRAAVALADRLNAIASRGQWRRDELAILVCPLEAWVFLDPRVVCRSGEPELVANIGDGLALTSLKADFEAFVLQCPQWVDGIYSQLSCRLSALGRKRTADPKLCDDA